MLEERGKSSFPRRRAAIEHTGETLISFFRPLLFRRESDSTTLGLFGEVTTRNRIVSYTLERLSRRSIFVVKDTCRYGGIIWTSVRQCEKRRSLHSHFTLLLTKTRIMRVRVRGVRVITNRHTLLTLSAQHVVDRNILSTSLSTTVRPLKFLTTVGDNCLTQRDSLNVHKTITR